MASADDRPNLPEDPPHTRLERACDELFEEVLRQTEAAARAQRDDAAAGDADRRRFVAAARDLAQANAAPEQAIDELVRLAAPKWIETVVRDEASRREFTSEIARVLRADAGSYKRLVSLWHRLAELA